jgi:hypothetical protein
LACAQVSRDEEGETKFDILTDAHPLIFLPLIFKTKKVLILVFQKEIEKIVFETNDLDASP